MLNCVLLQVFLLVGVCFSTWAAPLGSTPLPQERRCEQEQRLRDTSEHPASLHDDDKMCIISSIPITSSPLVQEPRGTAYVLSSTSEMRITVTETTQGDKIELFRRSSKAYTQYHVVSTEPTGESSAEETEQKLASAYESIPPVTHTVGPENENSRKELPISPENYAEQKVEPSLLPKQLRTDRPAPTLPHSDYTSLPYRDIEEDKGTKSRRMKQGGKWDVKATKNQFDEPKSSRGSEPSTAYASVSQSYRNINPDVTALTISHSYDEQIGGSAQDKERVVKENLFTTAEQDKVLVPALLTLSSKLAELGDTWTEPAHLQGVEEASVLPLLQDIGTEATMSSEDLPLIFEPSEDATPSSSSALASELSVTVVPSPGVLRETELEKTLIMDTDHSPHQSFPGPSDWPSPWQMSGAENSDTVSSSQMPIRRPFSEAAVEDSERTEMLQDPDVIPTSADVLRLSPSPVSLTTQQVADIKSTHSAVLKLVSGLEELESQENEDEEDDYADESEEEESEEELADVAVQSPTRPPYILIPPPPVWGQRNQGLIRSWVKLIREKAGYVSGMLAPVGIGIAGALLIVGALYGIRMIHRKRKNSLKQQRRKQPTEVRSGPDQAMLLADSSEDEF